MPARRDILALAAGALVGGGTGLWRRAAAESRPVRLRPPGAGRERDFLAACLRCGLCVEACPRDTLRLADLDDGVGAVAPHLVPRDVPCTLCQGEDEVQCIRVCPTEALRPVNDVADVRIGVAVIDEQRCWAFTGTVCRTCWHACPFPDRAIRLDQRLRPVVETDACTGCGLCEHACPTEPTSIVIEVGAMT